MVFENKGNISLNFTIIEVDLVKDWSLGKQQVVRRVRRSYRNVSRPLGFWFFHVFS